MTFGPMLALMLLLTLASPRPDILPPGQRAVQHELVVEAADGAALPALLAFPTQGFGQAMRVMPMEPFGFSSKYGTRLYVLEPGEALPRKVDALWAERHRSAAIPVREITGVAMGSPVTRVRTTLRASATADGRLQLAVRDTVHFDAQGRPVDRRQTFWLLLPAAAGALWLWWLARASPRAAP